MAEETKAETLASMGRTCASMGLLLIIGLCIVGAGKYTGLFILGGSVLLGIPAFILGILSFKAMTKEQLKARFNIPVKNKALTAVAGGFIVSILWIVILVLSAVYK